MESAQCPEFGTYPSEQRLVRAHVEEDFERARRAVDAAVHVLVETEHAPPLLLSVVRRFEPGTAARKRV